MKKKERRRDTKRDETKRNLKILEYVVLTLIADLSPYCMSSLSFSSESVFSTLEMFTTHGFILSALSSFFQGCNQSELKERFLLKM